MQKLNIVDSTHLVLLDSTKKPDTETSVSSPPGFPVALRRVGISGRMEPLLHLDLVLQQLAETVPGSKERERKREKAVELA